MTTHLTSRLPISLEFFPPKTPEGFVKLRVVRQALYGLKPEFCSVTFGAGGSTQTGTFNTVNEILAEGVDAASHFSCVGATKSTEPAWTPPSEFGGRAAAIRPAASPSVALAQTIHFSASPRPEPAAG